MGSERGEYRPIRRVLLDGPDFQQLSERARWVFVAMKLNLGPAGIEIQYVDAMKHHLAMQTGATAGQVEQAMDELERAGWLHREANVVWLDGQLTHDPHMDHRDNKHRTSIWRHLQGLPRVAIVGEFVRHHPEWFTAGEYTNAKGETRTIDAAPADLLNLLTRPSEGPSKAHRRPPGAPRTDNREQRTDTDTDANASDGDAVAGRTAEEEFFDVEIIEPDEDEPRAGTSDGVSVIPLHRPQPASDTLPFSDKDPGDDLTAGEVMAAWIVRKRPSLSKADRGRMAAAAARIVEGRTAWEVMLAMIGIECLWPFAPPGVVKNSEGRLWDLMDLEKNFAKAMDAAKNHPELRQAKFNAEFDQALAAGVWRT
jgi:hypothetical protein